MVLNHFTQALSKKGGHEILLQNQLNFQLNQTRGLPIYNLQSSTVLIPLLDAVSSCSS